MDRIALQAEVAPAATDGQEVVMSSRLDFIVIALALIVGVGLFLLFEFGRAALWCGNWGMVPQITWCGAQGPEPGRN
jgi:hypothetical protein